MKETLKSHFPFILHLILMNSIECDSLNSSFKINCCLSFLLIPKALSFVLGYFLHFGQAIVIRGLKLNSRNFL